MSTTLRLRWRAVGSSPELCSFRMEISLKIYKKNNEDQLNIIRILLPEEFGRRLKRGLALATTISRERNCCLLGGRCCAVGHRAIGDIMNRTRRSGRLFIRRQRSRRYGPEERTIRWPEWEARVCIHMYINYRYSDSRV